MSTNRTAIGTALLVVILGGVYFVNQKGTTVANESVGDVFSAESKKFVGNDQEGVTYNSTSGKAIQISLPLPGSVTGSDFTARGVAEKGWYEDGAFAYAVLDEKGAVLYEGVTKKSSGEVGEYVPFAAEVFLPREFTGSATLVLARGQSGDVENGAFLLVPIQVEP